MKTSTKRILWGVVVVVLILIGCGLFYVLPMAAVGAGYKAKILCSGVFVSKRDAQSVLDEDLALASMKLIDASIDHDERTATATAFGGLVTRKAIFREGLGATLVIDVSEEELRAQAGGDLKSAPPNQKDLPWPTGDVTTSEGPPAGIDTQKLADALDNAFSEPEPDPDRLRRTRAVVVVYDGQIIAERYAPGFTRDTPLLGWSMTKSVTNALVGILVGQGKLSVDEPAPVPEWSGPDDPRGSITLDQMLRMSSGLEFGEIYEDPRSDVCIMLFSVRDAAAYAADKPLETDPGGKWYYSSGTTNIISRIVRDTVGGTQADYFAFPRRALFDRIGMRSAVIEPDPSGTFVGSSYMYATARDWARFGLLYLQDGVWEGERILPEGWVDYSRKRTPGSDRGVYGAHFWLNPKGSLDESVESASRLPGDLYQCLGHEGQSVTIIPSRKTVIVRLGLTQDPGAWHLDSFIGDVLEAVPE